MFLKNRNIISKMKISKVTDYAALSADLYFHMDYNYSVGSFTKPPTCTLVNFTEERKKTFFIVCFLLFQVIN